MLQRTEYSKNETKYSLSCNSLNLEANKLCILLFQAGGLVLERMWPRRQTYGLESDMAAI